MCLRLRNDATRDIMRSPHSSRASSSQRTACVFAQTQHAWALHPKALPSSCSSTCSKCSRSPPNSYRPCHGGSSSNLGLRSVCCALLEASCVPLIALAANYWGSLLKNDELAAARRRMQELTVLETRAIVAETQVLAAQVAGDTAKILEGTNGLAQALSEFIHGKFTLHFLIAISCLGRCGSRYGYN